MAMPLSDFRRLGSTIGVGFQANARRCREVRPAVADCEFAEEDYVPAHLDHGR